jgi:hypothetical protein
MENKNKPSYKEEKRNYFKRVIKETLGLSNIKDLILCDSTFNRGMFGCMVDPPDHDSAAPNNFIPNNWSLVPPNQNHFGESSGVNG